MDSSGSCPDDFHRLVTFFRKVSSRPWKAANVIPNQSLGLDLFQLFFQQKKKSNQTKNQKSYFSQVKRSILNELCQVEHTRNSAWIEIGMHVLLGVSIKKRRTIGLFIKSKAGG
jgi:hypothetical protein